MTNSIAEFELSDVILVTGSNTTEMHPVISGFIKRAVRQGKTVILEIDVQGAKQARVIFPDALLIFILPPTEKDLIERMDHRGREAVDAAEERLSGASNEIAAAWQYYKYMVINEDLQQAVDECVQIIESA